jgi:succinyl-CoA synthetase beta subunit
LRLYEFEGKELFAKYGIPVPRGVLAKSAEEAERAAKEMGLPVVLKAQLKAGGRGKAGKVIRVASHEELAVAFARAMSPLAGEVPFGVLVEEFVPHEKEGYLGIVLDAARRDFLVIASSQGGVDVEQLGSKATSALSALSSPSELRLLLRRAGFSDREEEALLPVAKGLIELFEAIEGELVEINPVAISAGRAVALDAKVITDDNALFRHPELQRYERYSESEAIARKYGFSLVPLEGDVVVVGNGAGLVLASLDLVSDMGGKPAAFLDLGGGASAERVFQALRLANQLEGARAIFLNVFGGITRGSEVAEGIVRLYAEGLARRPLYARISGTEEQEARRLLAGLPVKLYATPEEAALAAIRGE